MEASTAPAPLPLQALSSQLFGNALAISTAKAAEALDCSRSQIYAMLNRGQLQGVALGTGKKARKQVSVLSLLSFISNGGVESPDRPSPAVRLGADQRRSSKGVL